MKAAPSIARAAGEFTAHDLMKEILHLVTQRWTDPQSFTKLAAAARLERIDARIYFLTQLRERVRQLPLKLFVSAEAREKMLEALQVALDQEISREEIA